jgi:hypothetical protein
LTLAIIGVVAAVLVGIVLVASLNRQQEPQTSVAVLPKTLPSSAQTSTLERVSSTPASPASRQVGPVESQAVPGQSRVRSSIDRDPPARPDVAHSADADQDMHDNEVRSIDPGLPASISRVIVGACAPCIDAHRQSYDAALHAQRGSSVLGRGTTSADAAHGAYHTAFREARRSPANGCCPHGQRWLP